MSILSGTAIVDVRTKGALGDGVNNDAFAFMAAAAALPPQGGVIYVPTPSVGYRIAPTGVNPIDLVNIGINITRDNVTIMGDGQTSMLLNDGCSVPLWMVGNNNTLDKIGLDLRVTASYYDAIGIGGDRCTIQRCWFDNSTQIARGNPRTVGSVSGRGLTRFRFLNNVTRNLMMGLGWSSVSGALIQGNAFLACQEMGFTLVSGAGGAVMNDVIFSHNYIEDATNCGVYIGSDGGAIQMSCNRVMIVDNWIRGVFSVGGVVIRVAHAMENVSVLNNQIDCSFPGVADNGLYGVAILEGNVGDVFKNCLIANNTISNAKLIGIFCKAAPRRPFRLDGNQFHGCPCAIWVQPLIEDAQDVIIERNVSNGGADVGINLLANPCSITAFLRDNMMRNHTPAGVKMTKIAGTSLGVRMTGNILGDDQLTPTQVQGVNWASAQGAGSPPTVVALDNDMTRSQTAFSPAADGTWTVR